MVVFGANVLIALVSPQTSSDDLARINKLIADLSKRKSYVGVPTPALAEFLVRTDGATQAILETLERKSGVRMLPFDKRAAYECALLDQKARVTGRKRGSAGDAPYQKVKVDRQIVAIAIANGAEMIVSGDDKLIAVARDMDLKAVTISELPIPPAAMQRPLTFNADDLRPGSRETQPTALPDPVPQQGEAPPPAQ